MLQPRAKRQFGYLFEFRGRGQQRRQRRWRLTTQTGRPLGNQRLWRNCLKAIRSLLLLRIRLNDLGRVRVTLGAASVRIRALFADSSIIGYSTRWVWSNEGDRTPTLERF